MANLRVAVIGCGGRGRGHMKILSEFEDTDIVAICDPVESARNNAGGHVQRIKTLWDN